MIIEIKDALNYNIKRALWFSLVIITTLKYVKETRHTRYALFLVVNV